MLNVNVICVGKLKETYWTQACAEYAKRLRPFCTLRLIEVPECRLPSQPSDAQIRKGMQTEGADILSRTGKGDTLIALCVEGKKMSSEGFAQLLSDVATRGCSTVDLIVGGSFGLSEEVKARCTYRLSVSDMTFPHQLFRVMLLEQLYRAFSIQSGTRYHK